MMNLINPRDSKPGVRPRLIVSLHRFGGRGDHMMQKVAWDHGLAERLPYDYLWFPNGLELNWRNENGEGYEWFPAQDLADSFDMLRRGAGKEEIAGRLQTSGEEWSRIARAEGENALVNAVVDIASERSAQRVVGPALRMNVILDEVKWRLGVPGNRVVGFGFSQGATMIAQMAMRRPRGPLGGLFAASGGTLNRLPRPVYTMPVALAAGQHEDNHYSGRQHAEDAASTLVRNGFPARHIVIADGGHNIYQQTVDELVAFAEQSVPGAVAEMRRVSGYERFAPNPAA